MAEKQPPPRPQHANPYLVNIHWGQIIFGVLLTLLVTDLYGRAVPWPGLTLPVFLELAGLLGLVLGFLFIYVPNMYRHGLMPDYSLKCRFCNGPVNRYSEFCEHCGADLIYEEALTQCHKCGVDVYVGTKHCPECGVRLQEKGNPKKGKKKQKLQDTASVDASLTQDGWDEPLDAGLGPKPWDKR